MNHFCYSFIDDETDDEITFEYYTTADYCWCKTYRNRKLIKTKRVSEEEYIAAYDSYMNY